MQTLCAKSGHCCIGECFIRFHSAIHYLILLICSMVLRFNFYWLLLLDSIVFCYTLLLIWSHTFQHTLSVSFFSPFVLRGDALHGDVFAIQQMTTWQKHRWGRRKTGKKGWARREEERMRDRNPKLDMVWMTKDISLLLRPHYVTNSPLDLHHLVVPEGLRIESRTSLCASKSVRCNRPDPDTANELLRNVRTSPQRPCTWQTQNYSSLQYLLSGLPLPTPMPSHLGYPWISLLRVWEKHELLLYRRHAQPFNTHLEALS